MDGLWLVLVQTSQTMKVVMSLFLWSLEMACELIGATKQKEGVKVLREEMEYYRNGAWIGFSWVNYPFPPIY